MIIKENLNNENLKDNNNKKYLIESIKDNYNKNSLIEYINPFNLNNNISIKGLKYCNINNEGNIVKSLTYKKEYKKNNSYK